MTILRAESLRSTRGWLASAVIGAGAVAWIAVALASGTYLEYSGYLGVVGIAIVLGSLEVTYLVWSTWALAQRGIAVASTSGAVLGSILIFASTSGDVTGRAFVGVASGVGLLGLATAMGLLGVYRATGKSTAATMTALVITLALAYFASVLWAAVP